MIRPHSKIKPTRVAPSQRSKVDFLRLAIAQLGHAADYINASRIVFNEAGLVDSSQIAAVLARDVRGLQNEMTVRLGSFLQTSLVTPQNGATPQALAREGGAK